MQEFLEKVSKSSYNVLEIFLPKRYEEKVCNFHQLVDRWYEPEDGNLSPCIHVFGPKTKINTVLETQTHEYINLKKENQETN